MLLYSGSKIISERQTISAAAELLEKYGLVLLSHSYDYLTLSFRLLYSGFNVKHLTTYVR